MAISDSFFVFIPILLITLFVLIPNQVIIVSHTILGKIIVIILILFYAFKDWMYGILVCLLVIFYYQSEIYETMLNYSSVIGETTILGENINTDLTYIPNSEFQEKYCENGLLKFKGMVVKPEMSEHIFPEINFKGNRCNVCETNCIYKIVNRPEQEISYKEIF
jgi:hypothetical protein